METRKRIDSIKDEKVLEARALQTSKGRLEKKKILLEGEEQIRWALGSSCKVEHVFAHDKIHEHPLFEELQKSNIPIFIATDGILKKISETTYLIPFIAVARFPSSLNVLTDDLIVVMDGVKDFGNVGTIVRTSSAFGISQFASTEKETDFYYKKTIDASRGSVFDSQLLSFASGPEAVRYLKEHGYQIVATTPYKSIVQSIVNLKAQPIAVVFGNETHGISKEVMDLADIKVQIPMTGTMESLNVGVAAGISLYEMKIKMVLSMLTKKIQESLGRNLYSTAKWIRLVFDAKIREATPFNADQAIMLMILKIDSKATKKQLYHDAGISNLVDFDLLVKPLVEGGYVIEIESGSALHITDKGEELIAKLWNIHEHTENVVLEGLSKEERNKLSVLLGRIQQNCEKIVPFS